jgi:DNA polymerase III delta prime subunit
MWYGVLFYYGVSMIDKVENQFLWVEAYRPKKIEDCILPERLKVPFREYVTSKNIPNLLLSGSAGVGKTTVAKALCEEVGCDYMVINGSSNNGVDMVRNTVVGYASTVSLSGGRKVIIIDEADYLTDNAQAAFRNFIEEFSNNCTFIFTCNFKEKIIEPLHSRCAVIDFRLNKDEKNAMAGSFFKRIKGILQQENVEAVDAVVAEVIKKHFPDFRRVLNELQRYSKFGKIDTDILSNVSDENIKKIVALLKDKDFGGIKKWVANNDYESATLYRKLFDALYDVVDPGYVPALVVTLADYQYKRAFVADGQLNDLALLSYIMVESKFK